MEVRVSLVLLLSARVGPINGIAYFRVGASGTWYGRERMGNRSWFFLRAWKGVPLRGETGALLEVESRIRRVGKGSVRPPRRRKFAWGTATEAFDVSRTFVKGSRHVGEWWNGPVRPWNWRTLVMTPRKLRIGKGSFWNLGTLVGYLG